MSTRCSTKDRALLMARSKLIFTPPLSSIESRLQNSDFFFGRLINTKHEENRKKGYSDEPLSGFKARSVNKGNKLASSVKNETSSKQKGVGGV